jgi:hypothetical protein
MTGTATTPNPYPDDPVMRAAWEQGRADRQAGRTWEQRTEYRSWAEQAAYLRGYYETTR